MAKPEAVGELRWFETEVLETSISASGQSVDKAIVLAVLGLAGR